MAMPSLAQIARRSLSVFHVGGLLRLRALAPLLRHRTMLVFEDRSWSWAEVYHEARRYAELFRRRREDAVRRGALERGEALTIGLYQDNSPSYLFAVFGAALDGDLVLGLNTGFRGETLAAVLNASDARLLLVAPEYRELLEPALAEVEGLDQDQVLVDGPASAGLASVDEALGAPLPVYKGRRARGAEPLMVIYTSGTTGVPKGIPCSHLKLLGAGVAISHETGLSARDRGYIAMPLFHSNAWLLGVMPLLFRGGSVVLKPRFSATAFENDILRYGVTCMNYVGQPVHYILAALERRHGSPEAVEAALAKHPDNHLRIACGNGATALDRQKLMRWLGMEHVYEVYGSTEAVISTMVKPGDPPDSVGELTSARVVILDEHNRECPPAEVDENGHITNYAEAVGEIAARVPRDNIFFDGYYRNPDATDRKYDGTYYHSGDLGHVRVVNGRRYLYFDGRTDDWIRKDGENFSADTVAHYAGELPGVHLAAAYGVPDPVADERVAVALQLTEGTSFDPQAALDYFQAQQNAGMDPKWMPDFVRIVDTMPMSDTNKILVRHLKREHFDLEHHPDMALWFRERGDEHYRRMTAEDYYRLRDAFIQNGRAQLLE